MASKHLKTRKNSKQQPGGLHSPGGREAAEKDIARRQAAEQRRSEREQARLQAALDRQELADRQAAERAAAAEKAAAEKQKASAEKQARRKKKGRTAPTPISAAGAQKNITDDDFRVELLAAAAARHAEPETSKTKKSGKTPKAPKKASEPPDKKEPAETDTAAAVIPISAAKKPDERPAAISTARYPTGNAADAPKRPRSSDRDGGRKSRKARREKKPAEPAFETTDENGELTDPGDRRMSPRELRLICVLLLVLLIIIAAGTLLWQNRDSILPDELVQTFTYTAQADEEYIFDAGSGQVFAQAGSGLAVATAGGVELIDRSGTVIAGKVVQMDSTAIAACQDFAVFYDLGGSKIVVTYTDGTTAEMSAGGSIVSLTVSDGGYITVTTEVTGYRDKVTVYTSALDTVYEWYSSSAWVISGEVSPDGRKLAVLSYTMSGSEVRFFRLDSEDQKAVYAVEDTVLLDVHWFTSDRLCAYSTRSAYFFDSDGSADTVYSFGGLYLTGCTFGGEDFAVFSLSRYRAGTSATLVSLDASGTEIGTVDISGEIIALTASGTEVLVLCPSYVTLFNSSLTEKGTINGLSGYKYAVIRGRGEALLITANGADVFSDFE